MIEEETQQEEILEAAEMHSDRMLSLLNEGRPYDGRNGRLTGNDLQSYPYIFNLSGRPRFEGSCGIGYNNSVI